MRLTKGHARRLPRALGGLSIFHFHCNLFAFKSARINESFGHEDFQEPEVIRFFRPQR
jgi:hypothetical protein